MSWPELAWPDLTDLAWPVWTWPDWTWPDLIWSNLNWTDLTWPYLTWPELTWSDPTWPDLIWTGLTWPDLTWHQGRILCVDPYLFSTPSILRYYFSSTLFSWQLHPPPHVDHITMPFMEKLRTYSKLLALQSFHRYMTFTRYLNKGKVILYLKSARSLIRPFTCNIGTSVFIK